MSTQEAAIGNRIVCRCPHLGKPLAVQPLANQVAPIAYACELYGDCTIVTYRGGTAKNRCDRCPHNELKPPLVQLGRKTTTTAAPTTTTKAPAAAPGIVAKAARLGVAMARWIAAGRPVVSADVQAQRRALCDPCPDRDAASDRCRRCGCSLGGTAVLPSKIAMATESCPAAKWPAEVS